MRRTVLLILVAQAGLLAGCDILNKLKGGDADAGDAAPVATAVPAVDGAAPPPNAPATTTPPLNPPPSVFPTNAPAPTGARPTDAGVRDAAAPVDAGAPRADSGAPPAPTPTLTIPPIPNLFDGGVFKFDAGGLKIPGTK
jgi:hypothetical protein